MRSCVIVLLLVFGFQFIAGRSTYIRYRRCSPKYMCVALSQCPRQSRVLHRTTDVATAVDHLQKHLCGLHDGVVEVCCHETFALVSVDSQDVATSITRHRNLRLINQHDCGVGIKNRIVGGTKTIPGEFPWIALLQYELGDGRLQFRCIGTLISDRYVLTAAHCVRTDDYSKQLAHVRLGEYKLKSHLDCAMNGIADEEGVLVCNNQLPRDYKVASTTIHPKFETTGHDHDIALLRLQDKVTVIPYTVVPICLPTKNLLNQGQDIADMKLDVVGWGFSEKEDVLPLSDVLLKTPVLHVVDKVCEKSTGLTILPSHMCVSVLDKSSTFCQGDEGGPLMTTLGNYVNTRISYQVAILSRTTSRCNATDQLPVAVYTRLDAYITWILDNMED